MILCGTDLGPSGEIAARWAAALARATGHTLRLVHVDDADHKGLEAFPESVRDAAATFHRRLDERRAEHESGLKHLADALGGQVERKHLSGRPWEQLVEHAEEAKAAMIVVGPHRTGLGSTSRRVVTHAPCPVLVVPPEGDEPPTFEGMSWVVGVAHDDRVAALLRDIGGFAARTKGKLVPTRVLPTPPESGGSELQTFLAKTDAAAREELAHLAQDLGVDVEPHVTNGRPAWQLLAEAASRRAGIAVAVHSGERPRDALRRFFLGSVTERILRETRKTPVYVSPAHTAS